MTSPPSPRRRARRLLGITAAAATISATAVTGTAYAASKERHRSHHESPSVKVTVFSPGEGDHSGTGGAGFIVDLAVDATGARGNSILSPTNGYHPFFNDPSSTTFHPGPDPGAPGLVVLLSTTPDTPGSPLQGPDTNLAGLFQLNGVAKVGDLAETWNTWLVGKPLFGTGHSTLTVYLVQGTAPAVVSNAKPVSNVVHVRFTIAP
jgi:hypothetical protein